MIAQLHIETALRGNCTVLKKTFFTQPFKVANVTEDKTGKDLRLMIMTASPGILDGDEYEINIDVEQNCSLHLQTQSYQRLYNMKVGAWQKTIIHVKDGGSFYFIPHPIVPHKASTFFTSNKIYLESNTTLLLGEVITCGRKESGESFLFNKYHSLTEIFINDKLVIKENILIQPSLIDVAAIGQLEGFTHQATLIFLHETAAIKEIIKSITEFLEEKSNIEFGVSITPKNGLILRLLAYKAEQLFDLLKLVTEKFILPHQTK